MTDPMTATPFDHANGGDPNFNALSAVAEGTLDPETREQLLVHLAVCGHCRTIVAELCRDRARAPVWRRGIAALPIAATVAVALAGGGLYWVLRERAPRADTPVALPEIPAPSPFGQGSSPSATPGSPEPSVVPSPSIRSSPTPERPPADRTRSAGTQSVGGKTFRLEAGEWIDTEYRATDFLPIVTIQSRQELASTPALVPFGSLGPRFTVVLNGTVYRVAVPALQP